MFTYILTILLGLIIGRIFYRNKITAKISQFIFPIVLLLLFFMGISIGRMHLKFDEVISLGGDALLITSGAIIGSLLGAFLLSRLITYFRRIEK